VNSCSATLGARPTARPSARWRPTSLCARRSALLCCRAGHCRPHHERRRAGRPSRQWRRGRRWWLPHQSSSRPWSRSRGTRRPGSPARCRLGREADMSVVRRNPQKSRPAALGAKTLTTVTRPDVKDLLAAKRQAGQSGRAHRAHTREDAGHRDYDGAPAEDQGPDRRPAQHVPGRRSEERTARVGYS